MTTVRDAKLHVLDIKLADMAETLVYWLDENSAYTALQIYFLCGVLTALIKEGWPSGEEPRIYTDLLAMLDRVGATVGPMIAAVELQRLPVKERVSCERQRKSRKKSVN